MWSSTLLFAHRLGCISTENKRSGAEENYHMGEGRTSLKRVLPLALPCMDLQPDAPAAAHVSISPPCTALAYAGSCCSRYPRTADSLKDC